MTAHQGKRTAAAPLQLPLLSDATLTLRAFSEADAPLIQEASSDPLIPLITTVPTSSDVAGAIAFIARQQRRMSAPGR